MPAIRRRPRIEEIEPRILYSADFSPEALAPVAEHRVLDAAGEFVGDSNAAQNAPAAQETSHEIVFVDTATPDYQRLVDDMLRRADEQRHLEVVLLDSDSNGIDRISVALNGRHDISAIHIISHGSDGEVQLGAARLNFDSLLQNAGQIRGWGQALSGDADLLIYGCDVAQDDAGKSLVDALSRLTGADVAASDDLTGASNQGGDWTLEYNTGHIDTGLAISTGEQMSWAGILATYSVTSTADAGAGTLREAIGLANANGGADSIEFAIVGGGVHTINVASALPDITGPVVLNGWSQGGGGYNGTPLIELDGTGLGAGVNGLVISGNGSTIQGLTINRFTGHGVLITGNSNVLIGNYIGVDSGGTLDRGNTRNGIEIIGANNTIGGTTAAERNIVSGNNESGIYINGGLASGNIVQGNYVGTNVAGTAAIQNNLLGVYVNGASGAQIGGTAAGTGNLISGNAASGVALSYGTGGAIVQGNLIGTNAAGTAGIANLRGVEIVDDNSNTIGGTAAGAGNTIAYNSGDGVEIKGTSANNSVLGNSIFSNGGSGIDLDANGTTANDLNDGDSGPNGLQNFPVISSAAYDGATLTLNGALNAADGTYRVEFFANTSADAGNYGEGRRYLGFANVVVAGNNGTFVNVNLAVAIAVGETVVATATSPTGATSEFSLNVSPTYTISGTIYNDVDGDADVVEGGTGTFRSVTVRLYQDDGDGVIEASDALVATTTTNASGVYSFTGLFDATYWVAVDSRTIGNASDISYNGGFGIGDVWAEQTYGDDASTGAIDLAARYGGRNVGIDTASNVSNSEHVARVAVAAADVSAVNWGFSFSAITDTRGNNVDDDGAANRMQQGTLRQFLLNSNAISGVQTSNFSIGGGGAQTITVSTAALPTLNDAVILDATTQESYAGTPLIILDGNGLAADGLRLVADGNTIRGFVIRDFAQEGIEITASSDNNVIQGNYIGALNTAGTVAAGEANSQNGVLVLGANNTIGGTNAADGNVISGNDWDGISIENADNNVVLGNYIGTNAAGTASLANAGNGITMSQGAANNTIGGTSAGARNVISGNDGVGVEFNGVGTSGNMLLGSYIGTNAAGASAVGNDAMGVIMRNGASSNTVGGTSAGAGNLISGNTNDGLAMWEPGTANNVVQGNKIGTNAAGTAEIHNTSNGIFIWNTGTGNTIGGSAAGAGNLVSGNWGVGIRIDDASGAIVQGNLIGVTASGAAALSNDTGIYITSASGNTIGGTAAGAGNVISGNDSDGIELSGAATTANVILGNLIGLSSDGTSAVANQGSGVLITSSASDNTIGGTAAGSRNVISGNVSHGISITGASNNKVLGNYIGTDAAGTADRGNQGNGVGLFSGAANNTIGGTTASARNVISGNDSSGVTLNGVGTSGNLVLGNYIGTDAGGTLDRGNSGEGVRIENGATSNTVGGTSAGAGNLISGNNSDGVDIRDSGTSNNIILGNYIGTDAAGTSGIAQQGHGVNISLGASGNTIGGTSAGAGNLIAFNNVSGVQISNATTIGNSILGNVIHTHGQLAIDLNGGTQNGDNVTANDGAGDADTGPNALQNYPTLISAVRSATQISIVGSLVSKASTNYRIEFFSIPQVSEDASGYGEAHAYLGFANVTTDGSGNVTFSATLTTVVAANSRITATATDLATGDTSELAANAISVANSAPVNTVPGAQTIPEDTSQAIAGISVNDPTGNLDTVQLSVVSGVLTVNLAGGATISAGASGTGTLTLSGTQVQINAALGTLAYQGNLNYQGADTLTVLSTDSLGSTDSDTVNITVSSVNDAPGGANNTVTTAQDNDYTFAAADFGFTDTNDTPANALSAVTITTIPGVGTVTLSGAAVTAGQSISAADITAGNLKFTPAAGQSGVGYASLTFQVQDNGGTANGGVDLDQSANTMTVDVTTTYTISGTVYHDVDGDADVAEGGTGTFRSVTVRLYQDDGDGVIEASDVLVGTTTTNATGVYSFSGLSNATYWVSVDSRTIGNVADVAYNGGFDSGDVWAEQTYGDDSSTAGVDLAARYGGRNVNTDSPGNVSTSEHVARIGVAGGNVSAVNWGFSFNAIVEARGDIVDDDGAADRLQQGTLRQFLLNANAISGVQTSNFSIGGGGLQTIIVTASALTTIDDAVILDATSQEGFAGIPLIILDGIGLSADGLRLSADGSTIRGLIIRNFDGNGIRIDAGSDNNFIQGNYLGALDENGNLAAATGNTQSGIRMLGANNTIGGTASAERNVISGNTGGGLTISGAGASGNLVRGNYIGTNAAGTVDIGNADDGVVITGGAQNNTIGGTAAGSRNVISGNADDGIDIDGVGTDGNVILGNYIGLNAAGTAALGNDSDGIVIGNSASGNIIGGSAAGAGNVISGNDLEGVRLNNNSTGSIVRGNLIGLNAAGTVTIGNGNDGVSINGGSSNNTIGGTGAGDGNTIVGNETGVQIAGVANGNAILGNAIYGNTDLGIDLGNDGVDVPDGATSVGQPNLRMDSASIQSALLGGTSLTLSGYVGNAPSSVTFAGARVEFFLSDDDASGYGEGRTYLGFLTANGNSQFSGVLTVAGLNVGDKITATATDAAGNTSEFSLNFTTVADPGSPPVNTVPGVQTINEDTATAIAGISVTDTNGNLATVALGVTNGVLSVNLAGGASISAGSNGSGALTLSGTQVQINAALASLSYQGNLNFAGADTLTVTSTDGAALSDIDTVSINVVGVNDAPAGTTATITTGEDVAYVFAAVDFGFSDPNDSPANTLSGVTVTTIPGAGSLTLSGVAVTAGQVISAANITAGNLRFTGANGASGASYASFTFQVQDNGATANGGIDLDASPNTLTIDVTAANDAPTGTDNTVSTLEETAYTFAVADFGYGDAADSPSNALTGVRITTIPGAGSLTLSGVAVTAGQTISTANISAGNLRFTPGLNGAGASYASFTFQVQDNGGTANGGIDLDASPNTLTIAVTNINDAPSGADTTVTALEDSAYIFAAVDFGFSDAADSPANALSGVRVTTLPSAGLLVLSGAAVSAGQSVSAADIAAGNLQLQTAANASGAGYASFTFQAQDNGGSANGGLSLDASANTITIDIGAIDDAPVITNNTLTLNAGDTIVLSSLDIGATDIDDPASALVFTVSGVAHGRFELAGTPGAPVASFTQAQIAAGQVRFVHDASENAPTYGISVSDGTLSVGPNFASISFTLPVVVAPELPVPTPDPEPTPTPAPRPPGPTGEPSTGESESTAPKEQHEQSGEAALAASAEQQQALDGTVTTFSSEVAPRAAPRIATFGVQSAVVPSSAVATPVVAETYTAIPTLDALSPQQVSFSVSPQNSWSISNAYTESAIAGKEERANPLLVSLDSTHLGGMALSAGAVWWASRITGLVGSLIASIPAWRQLDPLLVVNHNTGGEQDGTADGFDADAEADEIAVAMVLEGPQARKVTLPA